MHEAQQPARSDLSGLLESLRQARGWPKRALAERADISPTYMGQIESGIDPRTGKPYQPSAAVLLKLAQALAGDRPHETDRLYRDLMEAAGYTPPKGPAQGAPGVELTQLSSRAGEPDEQRDGPVEAPAAPAAFEWAALDRPADQPPFHRAVREDPVPQPYPAGDPRLERHLLPLLHHWGELTSMEQSAILEFAEFLDGKRRRRRRADVQS